MGDVWTWPAYVGVAGGGVIFLLIFLPIIVVEFRRFGRPSPRRIAALAAASIYAVALVAYTLLPLPTGDLMAWCGENAAPHNFRPGAFWHGLSTAVRDIGPLAALRSPTGLQVIFNVALFVPFGALVRVRSRSTVATTVLLGMLTSGLIEATQFTGIFGAIPCSYRVGDTDDIVTNTLGTLVGAVVAPVLMRLVPTAAALARGRQLARPVTVGRRWVGMAVDAALVVLVSVATVAVVNTARRLAGHGPLPPLAEFVLSALSAVGAVILAPSLIGSGASWGQRAVWLSPQWSGVRGSVTARTLRATIVLGPWTLSYLVASTTGVYSDRVGIIALLVCFVIGMIALVAAPCTPGRQGLSGLITRADMTDVRREPDRPPPGLTNQQARDTSSFDRSNR